MARHDADGTPISHRQFPAPPTIHPAAGAGRHPSTVRPTTPDSAAIHHPAQPAPPLAAATPAVEVGPGGDLEAAYHLGGWSLLLDEFELPPDAQLEYMEERAWERRETAGMRLRLLTAISRLPPPSRDVLRAHLSTGLHIEVQSVLLGMSQERYWHDLVAAAKNLLPSLAGELRALLPTQLLDAVAEAESTEALVPRRPEHVDEGDETVSTCREVA